MAITVAAVQNWGEHYKLSGYKKLLSDSKNWGSALVYFSTVASEVYVLLE